MAIRIAQPLYASLASTPTTDYSRQLAFSQSSFFVLPCPFSFCPYRATTPND